MKAVLRRVNISPKKANLVAGMVRGKNVKEALDILKFTPKKGARILYKVIHSAASNAKNNFKQPFNDLVITRILVTKGPTSKRSLPVSRGRSHPILKRTAHITVEVNVPEDMKKDGKVKAEKIVTPSADTTAKATSEKIEAKKAVKEKKVKAVKTAVKHKKSEKEAQGK
jgi:large subunit ribosomal protein L22